MEYLARKKEEHMFKTQQVSQQIEYDSFWELMDAATNKSHKMTQLSYIIEEEHNGKTVKMKKFDWVQMFESILDFKPEVIGDHLFMHNTTSPALKQKLHKHIMKTYDEAEAFTNDEWKALNLDKFNTTGPITITDQLNKLYIRDVIVDAVNNFDPSKTKLYNTPVYVCISSIQGTSEQSKKKAYSYHMSALILLKGVVYSIGMSQENTKQHNETDIINLNSLLSKAIILSPEEPYEEQHSVAIIDMGILTNPQLKIIEDMISTSPIKCKLYSNFDQDKTKNLVFSEFILEPEINYCRFPGRISGAISTVSRALGRETKPHMNCAAFVENIFGIKCKSHIVGISNPNWCRRKPGNYPAKFTAEQLDLIIVAYKQNNLAMFMSALENAQIDAVIPRQKHVHKVPKSRRPATPSPTKRKRKMTPPASHVSTTTTTNANPTKRRMSSTHARII